MINIVICLDSSLSHQLLMLVIGLKQLLLMLDKKATGGRVQLMLPILPLRISCFIVVAVFLLPGRAGNISEIQYVV